MGSQFLNSSVDGDGSDDASESTSKKIEELIQLNCKNLNSYQHTIIVRLLQKYSQLIDHFELTKFIRECFPVQNGNMGQQFLELESDQVHSYMLNQYQMKSQMFTVAELSLSEYLKIKKYNKGIYFGEMVNNLRHGRGILINSNGTLYEGEFQSDFKYGKGFELMKNNACYFGEYVNSLPEGIGVLRWKSDEYYYGQWFGGKKHGIGKWLSAKGDFYIGDWVNGQTEGKGLHVWINGEIYYGEVLNNLKHGSGREFFRNKDVYEGLYANGKPNGAGVYQWYDGSIYNGDFVNGLRHGRGIWQLNRKQSTDIYEGEYMNDKKCGQGHYTWENGNYYEGTFYNDKRNGEGTLVWQDGATYVGSWQDGVMHGYGEFLQEDGSAYRGLWKMNQMVDNSESITRVSLSEFPQLHNVRTNAITKQRGRMYAYAEDYDTAYRPLSKLLGTNNKSLQPNLESTRESSQLNFQRPGNKREVSSVQRKQFQTESRQRMQSESRSIKQQRYHDESNDEKVLQIYKLRQQLPLISHRSVQIDKEISHRSIQVNKEIMHRSVQVDREIMHRSIQVNKEMSHKSIQVTEMKDVRTQTQKQTIINSNERHSQLTRNIYTQCSTEKLLTQITEEDRLLDKHQKYQSLSPNTKLKPNHGISQIPPYSPQYPPQQQREFDQFGTKYLTDKERRLWAMREKKLMLNPKRYENIWNSHVINRIRNHLYPPIWMPTSKNIII